MTRSQHETRAWVRSDMEIKLTASRRETMKRLGRVKASHYVESMGYDQLREKYMELSAAIAASKAEGSDATPRLSNLECVSIIGEMEAIADAAKQWVETRTGRMQKRFHETFPSMDFEAIMEQSAFLEEVQQYRQREQEAQALKPSHTRYLARNRNVHPPEDPTRFMENITVGAVRTGLPDCVMQRILARNEKAIDEERTGWERFPNSSRSRV